MWYSAIKHTVLTGSSHYRSRGRWLRWWTPSQRISRLSAERAPVELAGWSPDHCPFPGINTPSLIINPATHLCNTIFCYHYYVANYLSYNVILQLFCIIGHNHFKYRLNCRMGGMFVCNKVTSFSKIRRKGIYGFAMLLRAIMLIIIINIIPLLSLTLLIPQGSLPACRNSGSRFYIRDEPQRLKLERFNICTEWHIIEYTL